MGLFSRSKKTKAPAKPKKKTAAKPAKAKAGRPKAAKKVAAGKGKEKKLAPKKAELKPQTPAKASAASKPSAATAPAPASPKAPGAKAPGAKAPGAKAPGAKAPAKTSKKGGRKSSLAMRRGPNGEPFVPGDLLLPNGAGSHDEVQYLLRGAVAAEHPVPEAGVQEILAKPGGSGLGLEQGDLARYSDGMADRFLRGTIEPLLSLRQPPRRSFAGVVERAKHRRREVGAFLRGLDLGRTETSHMDAHAEASLQNLMEWAARLEILTDADEPNQVDYTQFHRVLDQLDSITEALIVDVELTLRRLRDRMRA
jgi:hypothetical protein